MNANYISSRYPWICGGVDSVAALLNKTSRASVEGVREIEARLGSYKQGTFVNGVTAEKFAEIQKDLDSYPDWISISPLTESNDFFYPYPPMNTIRTSTIFDGSPNGPTIHHIRKVFVGKCRLSCQSLDKSPIDDLYDVQVSSNIEVPVPPDQLPKTVNPTKVRIKQRKSYYYGGTVANPTWNIALTKTWTGTTLAQAEQNQRNNHDTTYEVEVELVDFETYVRSNNISYAAVSLLLKVADFLPTTKYFEIIPKP